MLFDLMIYVLLPSLTRFLRKQALSNHTDELVNDKFATHSIFVVQVQIDHGVPCRRVVNKLIGEQSNLSKSRMRY